MMESIRKRSDRFFLCKVATKRVQESGVVKSVKETFAINASCWGEAEKRILETMSHYDDMPEIKDIRPSRYDEIVFSSSDNADKWFSAKLEFIVLDEWSGKEKKVPHYILLNAGSLDEANKMVMEVMRGSMADFDKTEIKDSRIADVFEYDS